MLRRTFDLRKKQLVELEGFSVFVMPDNYIGRSIIATRTYEPNVTRVIRSVLKEKDVFLDIGANVGYFSMLAASIVGSHGKVLSFEPNPQNVQLIYASILQNHASNVVVLPYAVSDTSAILRFVTVGSNGGVMTPHGESHSNSILVQSVILDQALSHEPRIDLVKMDIEAHEPAAMRGMVGLVGKHRPRLITEFHPWAMRLNNVEAPENYLHQLFGLGYRVAVILPSGDLHASPSVDAVMAYWQSLASDTVHLDLLSEPQEI